MKKSLFSLIIVSALWLTACTIQVPTAPAGTIPDSAPSATEMATAEPATETMTETLMVTATVAADTVVTTTESMTDTAMMTATDMTTATDMMTMTETMTGTDMMTATETMTETVAVTLPDTSGMTIAEIVQSVDNLSMFADAVAAADMELALSTDGPLTVFVPGNAAFAAASPEVMAELLADPVQLGELLQYHLVIDAIDSTGLAQLDTVATAAGQPITVSIDLNGGLMVNTALIVYADIPAANGIIHVINQILTPPTLDLQFPVVNPALMSLANSPENMTLEELKRADTSTQTIVEILNSISGLTTIATAIDAGGLNAPLQGNGPFTLFVPTDPAFRELPDADLQALLNDPAALADLLQYHLVMGVVTSADMEELPTLLNAAGEELSIRVQTDGRIFVNGAPVYQADIEAANGVIHVIGKVLLPSN